jgi:hypothetical protein
MAGYLLAASWIGLDEPRILVRVTLGRLARRSHDGREP